MARLAINPDYAPLLAELGLTLPGDFLRLAGVIWCGHPDRNVSYLYLETRDGKVPVFLKREHRVRWRDRLGSALSGFGLVSKSLREFAMLRRLHELGIRGPEAIAAGQVGGRAFLLVREEQGAVDLRSLLQRATPRERRQLAVRLGETLARMHEAGIDHPDMYAKHVLVREDSSVRETINQSRLPRVQGRGEKKTELDSEKKSMTLLDWQRSRPCRRVTWSRRWRDLAALDATLADDLAGGRERLLCLRAYLAACSSHRGKLPASTVAAKEIRRRAARLLQHRRIREMRQPPLATGSQNLIWLDSEALCVTRQFQEENQGRLPEYLQEIYRHAPANPARQMIQLAPGRRACLTQRRQRCWRQWFWGKLRGRAPVSPELQQAGTLFRLERYRVRVPRLLAVGQRQRFPGRLESFLLVEPVRGTVHLGDWWREHGSRAALRPRCLVIEQVARFCRAVHDAGCVLGTESELLLLWHSAEQVEVMPQGVEGVRSVRRPQRAALAGDLRRLRERFLPGCTRTERWRLLKHYLGTSDRTVLREWLRLVSPRRLQRSRP
jgi:hypothetical protein